MKKLTSTSILFFVVFSILLLLQPQKSYSQIEDENNPKTWKYFRILARTSDDSIFVKLQDDLFIEPKLESYVIVVNILNPDPISQYIVLGDEASPDAQRFAWSQVSPEVQQGLLNWTGTNKENLNVKGLNYGSVFTNVIKQIKLKEVVAPPRNLRQIQSTTHYINPYMQFFGGDPLGIPFKRSIGISLAFGTPYSGPIETDMVGANFHILGVTFGITTRIREFVVNDSSTSQGLTFSPYNNIYASELGFKVSYVIPFGNFLEVGYFSTIKDKEDSVATAGPAPNVLDQTSGDDSLMMKNNVLNGSYFNWEFRYPFTAFGSTKAKVYVAKYLGEVNVGFIGREMRLAGSVFDARFNYTFKGKRYGQFLIEAMIQNIGEGFGISSFAIGPSIRLGRKDSGKFGALTVFLNARVKLGDYFEERF